MGHIRGDNLPAALTTFVDRDREVSEVKDLLEQARLITLTGVGGVGKTRLAVQAAAEVKARFADGVWLADLSPLDDPDLLAHAVSGALGVQDQSVRPQTDVLAEFMLDKSLLLILDTCEHQITACAELAQELLRRAPGLRILATSRVPLNSHGEHRYAVEPLATATTNFADNAAAALFVDRARAVNPDLEPGPDVLELCRRLDGIPLAIELAAVRLRGLTISQVVERLDDRFAALERASRTTVRRHQTLRAAIGWSHELCEPLERLLWARLSVFAGSFDAQAVRTVCGSEELPAAAVDATIAALVDKSIVVREEDRYRMLDTLRGYGAEWLDELGERDRLRRRHLDHYLELAAAFGREWFGPDQYGWRRRLHDELPNIRAALEFSFAHPGEAPNGLELAALLAEFWISGGQVREGRHYLERGLALAAGAHPVRTRALWACAWAAVVQGDAEPAERHLAECRDAAERQADPISAAWATGLSGIVAQMRGDLDAAVRLTRQGVESLSGRDEPRELTLKAGMGLALIGRGDLEQALAALNEVSDRCAARGERWIRSFADQFRGIGRLAQGETATAGTLIRRAALEKNALEDGFGLAITIDVLAQVVVAGGDAERAARLLGVADRLWRTLGTPQMGLAAFSEPRRQCEEAIRKLIGDDLYLKAFEEGRSLDMDDGIAYALSPSP